MNDIAAIIRAAYAARGLDPTIGLRTARIESGFNPAAKNPNSSASGLFQFIDSTWNRYGGGRDRFDPAASAEAAAALTSDNRDFLRKRLGRDPTPGELYLAHQQGAFGAYRLLSNPDAPASSIVGDAAARLNRGSGLTARQFADMWSRKMGEGTDGGDGGTAPVVAAQNTPQAPAAAPQGNQALADVFASLAAAQKPVQPAQPGRAGLTRRTNAANILAAGSDPMETLA